MLCDICHEREARIQIKKIEKGREQEYNVCEVCISESIGQSMEFFNLSDSVINSLSDMLAGFSDTGIREDKKEKSCSNCGLTISEFQDTGRVGCEKCYEVYEDKLSALLNRLQGAIQHAGKSLPGLEHRHEIENLELELKKSIEEEEYERAAILRDKIREFRSGK